MKRFTLFITLLFFATGLVPGQELVLKKSETIDEQVVTNDQGIRVIYADKTKKKAQGNPVEYYINNVLIGNSEDGFSILNNLDPQEIEDIKIVKPSGTNNSVSLAQIRITVKNNYTPKLISLTEIKEKYTNLGKSSAVFLIDEKLIEKDYDKYMVDENRIFAITIDKFTNPKENLEINLVKITKRKGTGKEGEKNIIIRGSSN